MQKLEGGEQNEIKEEQFNESELEDLEADLQISSQPPLLDTDLQ